MLKKFMCFFCPLFKEGQVWFLLGLQELSEDPCMITSLPCTALKFYWFLSKTHYTSQSTMVHEIIILVAHDCGYPLSRYTCRATRVAADFLDFIAFCRCSTGVALHPLKIMVPHLPLPVPGEVSHRNLGLKRCRATRGCRSYSCGCVALHCATKIIIRMGIIIPG